MKTWQMTVLVLFHAICIPASGQDNAFDTTAFSGDWERDTAVVTYSNVPESYRSPVNLPLPDGGPTVEAPFTGQGREVFLANKPGYGPNAREFERNDPFGRCVPTGIPRQLNVEIIEPHDTFEMVVMEDRIFQFFEYRHDWREIWLDGRELPALEDTWPTFNGFSVGRFEDGMLIVDSVGFDERTWLDKYGYPHSEEMRLQERYRLIDENTLELTMTITDPVMYAKSWESDTKIYSLNRDKYHDWDEQVYCVPEEEMEAQQFYGTGNLIVE